MTDILTQITPILKATPVRWTAMLATFPQELTSRKPAAGEWSAVECLVHIIDVERVFNTRLQAFLAGEDLPSFDPDAEGTAWEPGSNPAVLAQKFAEMRTASLEALGKVMPEDYARTARHAQLGEVTLDHMLHEWAAHDLSHTVQAEEAMMQPFIEGCGPWHVFFEAHKAAK